MLDPLDIRGPIDVRGVLRASDDEAPPRRPLFPLPGAVLLPRTRLPLHIFEPRYRAMVSEAMARDRLIGMIQPRTSARSR